MTVPTPIADEIAKLVQLTTRLEAGLHPRTAASLSRLVRLMNCYYSNLIEGHNTTPREIEQALTNQITAPGIPEERRDLLREAYAHVALQEMIDESHAEGQLPEPASLAFIQHLHKGFYALATPEMLHIQGGGRSFQMVPGQLRRLPEHDNTVGRHIPPSSQVVATFMAYFEEKYRVAGMGQSTQIVAIAAAHHRFNYIHPFPDGNGRVSRLMSHAMGLKAGIGAHGLWSISRGLARGLRSRSEYKAHMDQADTPRQSDYDGRGNLSQRAFEAFILWFLQVCVDQVSFMSDQFDFRQFEKRLGDYVEFRRWRPEAAYLLKAVWRYGELSRGEATRVTGLKERTARALLGDLIQAGILDSNTPKGPVSLRFPVESAELLFPALFPQS